MDRAATAGGLVAPRIPPASKFATDRNPKTLPTDLCGSNYLQCCLQLLHTCRPEHESSNNFSLSTVDDDDGDDDNDDVIKN